MLDSSRYLHQRLTLIVRWMSILLPVVCAVLLLSQVVFAKTVYVINDGTTTVIHTSYTTDPEQVLSEAGIQLDEDDTFATQDGIGCAEITIMRQAVVGIVSPGGGVTLKTCSQTVAEVLKEANLLLGQYDHLSVDLDAPVYDGMIIEIVRQVTTEETYTVSTPYDTLYVLDRALDPHQQQELVPGREGQLLCVDSVYYRNGEQIERRESSRTVIAEPVSRIVAVGSLEGIPQEQVLMPDSSENGALNAIVGNGQLYIGEGLIVTPDGQILTYTDTLQVKATAYHNTDPGCTIYTAIGTLCRVGAIAVDPKVIPYGTRMYIVTNDGEYIYGIAVAEDCGGAIKGNRVDLYFDTTDECWTFGVRNATVYFLG